MRNFMYRLARFMQGRYGYDRYGKCLILAGLIIDLCGSIFRLLWLSVAGDVILIYEFYRMFSRNMVRRGIENDRYIHVTMMIRHRFLAVRKQLCDHSVHYYVCPQCGQIVRVPKGHGRITVTCPNCHRQFDRRS